MSWLFAFEKKCFDPNEAFYMLFELSLVADRANRPALSRAHEGRWNADNEVLRSQKGENGKDEILATFGACDPRHQLRREKSVPCISTRAP